MTNLKQIVRQRRLTSQEVAKYNDVRAKIEKELPELIARDNVSEEARKLLRLETLETRNRDTLDFHEVAVWNIKTIIEKAFEAGRQVGLSSKKSKSRSGKRFHLLHVYGSVDPSIVGKSHKDYESLVKAARKFVKSGDYTEGEDGVFYTVISGKTVRVSAFDNSDLEDEN
jgi:hypothetical protein